MPVYIDGDSAGAQKLGARFKVSGYPTMLLFNPQGTEITRLPGEVDGPRYTQLLTLGMSAQRPAKEVLAQALADPQALGTNDWRLLAFYAWDTDEQQLVPKDRIPATLKRLADACPAAPPEIATRLRLMALAAVDAKSSRRPDPAAHATLQALLADANAARVHTDLLTNAAAEIVRASSAPGSAPRTELLAAFDAALKRFEADATLSRADRMQALIAQVDLARIDARNDKAPVVLPAPLLADIRAQTARADREIRDGYERQAVITAAAYLLDQAGLSTESDALLQANLATSHSPYYLMSELAENAKRRGDTAQALRWSREAFETSEGPATRLQWGASYIRMLVELAPRDEGLIERTASRLLDEAGRQPDAFYERSGRSLARVGASLQRWNKGRVHAAAIGRLQAQLAGLCAALPPDGPQRARCEPLLKAGAPALV